MRLLVRLRRSLCICYRSNLLCITEVSGRTSLTDNSRLNSSKSESRTEFRDNIGNLQDPRIIFYVSEFLQLV